MWYRERHDLWEGLANEYHTIDEPCIGDVDLLTIDTPDTQSGENNHPEKFLRQYYSCVVRIPSPQEEGRSQHRVGTATQPGPNEVTAGQPFS
jgi:hypothetical protein